MKNLQRQTDKFVITAREFSSRGAAFLIVMLGVLLQASHTTLLMYDIAAFDQVWLRFVVAFGIGLFISSALAYFTIIWDGKDKNILMIINVFFYFEVFTNIFYFFNSLIFSVGDFAAVTLQSWLYLIIAMPFAFIMPYTIKKFGGTINTAKPVDFGTIDIDKSQQKDNEQLSSIEYEAINDKIETILEETNDKFKNFDEFFKQALEKNNTYLENLNIEKLQEKISKINENVDKFEDFIKTFDESQYLKKGQHVAIKVGDKTSTIKFD